MKAVATFWIFINNDLSPAEPRERSLSRLQWALTHKTFNFWQLSCSLLLSSHINWMESLHPTV